ncbi:glutamate decarboxylase [Planctomycetes bacterium TBK1r]|uniref:Glutamate decarboxylase n=1 Tax=Stieleria magnilauensis TaxID=2527963 RepID=A0ABX5XVI0_9BACT|nr:Glutamate decarboxylase beta [Planctomycetes bacterium TBK1r]
MVHKIVDLQEIDPEDAFLTPAYGGRVTSQPVPKYEIPTDGMPPQVAYNLIRDELILDGNSRLNLATFVTTWMEDDAKRLMAETFDKNMIDKDEYPQTAEIELRCVNILSRLWNAPETGQATGCSTVGSSEAAMLGGMALKWKWRERRKAQGKPTDKPNMVMGINVQVCWEKFCRYWEIEPRFVPMEGDRYCLTATEATKLVDENTIGVVAIMGSTFDGRYENVKELNDALETLNAEHGWEVPIHVDGASGGFVAPFLQPELEWDFRLPLVKSINASGHKFGLVFPGVGWIVWRDATELPEELIFHCNYLGGDLPNFALNFSRPGNQVLAQYYNFLRLGRDGYRRIHQNSQDVALYLSGQIAELGPFSLISDGSDIPVFAFTTNERASFSVFDMSDKLREHGWLVPAYTFPKNREDLGVLRCVCKEGFTRDMADMLFGHLAAAVKHFDSHPEQVANSERPSFHH